MRRRESDAEVMLSDHFSPFQWDHLRKMYLALLCISASSTLGSCFSEYIGSSFALFGASMSFYCFRLISPWHAKKRACMICLGAFFGWAFVNPWLIWFLSVDAGLIVTLLSATCVGFGCYWVVSKWTSRFGRVYFTAICLCSLMVLKCLLICSYVFGGDSAYWKYQVLMYPFVLWCMMYVAAYSQFVKMKVRGGESDYVMHAICLFVAFPSVVMLSTKVMKEMYRRFCIDENLD